MRELVLRYPAMVEQLHIGRHRFDGVQDLLDLGQSESFVDGQRAAREPAVLLEQPLAKFRRCESEVDRSSTLVVVVQLRTRCAEASPTSTAGEKPGRGRCSISV